MRFEPGSRGWTTFLQLGWFTAWLVITSVAFLLDPSPSGHGTHRQLGLPPCPSVLLFGRLCPGCGLTTSFTATLHGDFHGGFVAHPFGTLLYALFTALAFATLFAVIKGKKLQTNTKGFNIALIAMFSLFFAYGVWRFFTVPVG